MDGAPRVRAVVFDQDGTWSAGWGHQSPGIDPSDADVWADSPAHLLQLVVGG